MSNKSSPWNRLGLLSLATLSILMGTWLALAVVGNIFTVITGYLLDLEMLYLLLSGLLIAFSVYIAFASSLVTDIKTSVIRYISGTTSSGLANASIAPITIAKFDYKLDDPDDPAKFSAFLDTPLIQSSKHYVISPAEYVEKILLSQASELQAKYQSRIVVDTKVTRGSLDISVVINAVMTAVQLYASGKDIFDSTYVYRDMLSSLIDRISGEYKRKSDRNVKVTGGVEFKAKPDLPQSTNSSIGSPALSGGTPVNVTNSYVPPQSGKEVNVSVNMSGGRSGFSGCVNSCLLFALVSVVVLAALVLIFVDYDTRLQLLDQLIYDAGTLLRVLGEYFVTLGNVIAPTNRS